MDRTLAMVTCAHRGDDVRIYRKEARFLALNGWRVTVIAPDCSGEGKDGVRFVPIPAAKSRAERFMFSHSAVLSAVERTKANILILHDPELLPLIPILRNMGRRVIYDAHEDLPKSVLSRGWIAAPLRYPAYFFAEALLSRYLPRANGIIAATAPIANRFSKYGLSATLVHNMPTAEDTELIEHALLHNDSAKNAVCYAGAISESRGIRTMIKACSMAGAKLLLAGRFESDKLRLSLEKMPEYSSVSYEGVLSREKTAQLYARSRAGLLILDDTPAYRESEPIKLFEYLSAGLPVIASDFEHWRHLGTGDRIRFCAPSDYKAVAKIIKSVLSDDMYCRQIRFARAAMQKKYCFDPQGKALLDLCERIAGDKP